MVGVNLSLSEAIFFFEILIEFLPVLVKKMARDGLISHISWKICSILYTFHFQDSGG